MEKTFDFLKHRTHINFVSTLNEGKPSCRPFGDPILFDEKLYAMTNAQKNVAKQLAKDNHVCIVACDGNNWIRINAQMIDESNNIEAKKAAIAEFDWAEAEGYTLDNPDFKLFRIGNAKSAIYNIDGEIIAEEEF